jgi:hypothetical protein
LPNLLAAVEVLPAHLVSKNGRNLLHGIRAALAQLFSQPPFCIGGHSGLCAIVVVFAACIIAICPLLSSLLRVWVLDALGWAAVHEDLLSVLYLVST